MVKNTLANGEGRNFGGNCGKLRELMASLGVDGVAGNPHGNVLCLNSGWHKK